MKEHRPWGYYEILLDNTNVKVKKIVVNKGCRLSLQSHKHRSETWAVVQGMGKVTIDDSDNVLLPKNTSYIPQGSKHRMTNVTSNMVEDQTLIFIEVQHSNDGIFDESDIIRYEDDYNRV